MTAIDAAYERGILTAQQYANELRNLQIEMIEFRMATGDATIAEGFVAQLARMSQAAQNWRAEVSTLMADTFMSISDRAADAFGRAIAYGEDFGKALEDIARGAVAELISSLVKLAIRWVINHTIGKALDTAAQASMATTTAVSAAQGAMVAAAWAPAAAAVSLATGGANSVPAMTGMAAAFGMSRLLSMIPGFADGGMIGGKGGPRDDANLARVSRGEFIVNARATRNNRATLEAINEGRALPGRDVTVNMDVTINGAADPAASAQQVASKVKQAVRDVLREERRPGGMLS
jgi:hypothetical protein